MTELFGNEIPKPDTLFMKPITKLSLIAAAFAAIGSGVVFADDPQLQSRLDLHRSQWPAAERPTTIAFYSGHRAFTHHRMMQKSETADMRFELRDTGHGQLRGVYTTVR